MGPALDYFRGAYKHRTRLGDRIVSNYENSQRDRSRCGDCYMDAYERVQLAMRQVGDGRPLGSWDKHRMFCTIWGSQIELGKKKWKEIPDIFRGRGAPGAMVGDGRGTVLMEADQIWSGGLEPGAVLQTWLNFSDYIRVVNGDKPLAYGHSFIHKEYVYRGNSIVGMKVIDNNFHGTTTITRGRWGYWVATNVRCLGAGATPRIPDPWWPDGPAESEKVAEPAHYGPPG